MNHRKLAAWCSQAFLLCSLPLAAQVTVYVDAQNGSNFNNGGQATPWRTVDFALNGPHSPLPQGSTIQLIGTDGVEYDAANGEAFPWTLYGNINLIAGPNGSGSDYIIDPGNQHAIQYQAGVDVTNSLIDGLSIIGPSAPLGMDLSSSGGMIMAPTVQNCTIDVNANYSDGILITGAWPDVHSITLQDNQITAPDNAIEIDLDSIANCESKLLRNVLDANDNGIYLTGSSDLGVILAQGNDVLSGRDGIYANSFTSPMRINGNNLVKDGTRSDSGIYQNSSHWLSGSSMSGNTISGFRYGIEISYTDGVTMDNNAISDCSYGMYYFRCNNVRFSDNDVTADNGVYTNSSGGYNGLVVERNDFILTNRGIWLEYSNNDGVRLTNNNFIGGVNGIYLNNLDNNRIIGNRIEDCSGTAIHLYYCDNNVVGGNTILRAGSHGIWDAVAIGGNISSNIIAECSGNGVHLEPTSTTDATLVTQNTFHTNVGYGLYSNLASSTPAYVGNNIFWNNNGLSNDFFGLSVGQYYSNIIHTGGSPGNGNLNSDPNVDPITYHLNSGSICIESGDPAWVVFNRDVDGQPRVSDSDWDRQPRPEIGADEFCETWLSIASHYYAPGDQVDVQVSSMAGGTVSLYAATDWLGTPIDPNLFNNTIYGSVILNLSMLYGSGPITNGATDGTGSATLPVVLPSLTTTDGLFVGLEALVTAANGAGQASNAEVFQIRL